MSKITNEGLAQDAL